MISTNLVKLQSCPTKLVKLLSFGRLDVPTKLVKLLPESELSVKLVKPEVNYFCLPYMYMRNPLNSSVVRAC